MRRAADSFVFPLDPDEKANEFALPYWRILSAIDMVDVQVFNLPNQKPVAATAATTPFEPWCIGKRPKLSRARAESGQETATSTPWT